MIPKAINSPIFQFGISFVLILGAALCIYTPSYLYFKWAANYANQIMFSYLFLGFALMFLKQSRLMFTSFACCAALCFHLNNSVDSPFTDSNIKTNQNNVISVAHFSTSKSVESISETIELIKSHNADLVSIQEIDHLWAAELSACMIEFYPSMIMIPDTGFCGLALLSKYPLESIDTFHFNNKPNLIGKVSTPYSKINLISSHTLPAKDKTSYNQLVSHLNVLSDKIKEFDAPYITLGEYNAVSWSYEIKEFRNSSGLKDSRKGISPTFPSGQMDFMEIPVDHIFYSNHLRCLDFETLDGKETSHLGIMGIYEFKPTPKTLNVSKTI